MTVMFDRFFGVHPEVIRSGIWARLSPSARNLYIAIMHQSERFCSHEIRCTDPELRRLSGMAPRSACNARKECKEEGLLEYKRKLGNIYLYTILDPTTCRPYPVSHPKEQYRYRPKQMLGRSDSAAPVEAPPKKPEVRGLPGIFEK